jgi:hypothetical protein
MTKPLPDTKSITLREPLAWGDQKVTQLDLKEPTAEQVEAAMKFDGMTSNMELVAANTGIPRAVIGKMKIRDLNACVDFLKPFISGDTDPGTGKKS